jgi:hypothetical protein
MSALLCRWLNSNEVNLSVKVDPSTLEKEFANGYRFAEIFANANAAQNIGLLHVDDLPLFRNSRHRNCAVENFTMLLPIFKRIGLSIPPEKVRKIVIEERGACSDVLFKIREAFNSADGKVPKVEFRKFENSIFNYTRDEKPLLPQIRKATVLHETIIDPRSSKQNRDIAIHLRHFEEEQNVYQEKVAYMEVEEIKDQKKKWQTKRLIEKETLKEKRQWAINKEKEDVRKWKKTQDLKILRQRKQLEFELSVLEKQRRKKKMLKKKLTREQMEGIEMFDRNRKRLGVGGDEEEELPEDPELLKIERITPFQHLKRLKKTVAQETKTFAAPARNYMKQLHSKRVSDKIARKEREARQRKQDVDQKKAQINAQQSKNEAKLLRKLLGIGRAERKEAHVLWEKRQKEKRNIKNKKDLLQLKNQRYNDKIDSYFTTFIEESNVKFDERKEEEAKERTKLRIAREERSLAKTRERTGWVKDFVKQLVGVALIVVKEHERNASIGREPVIGAKEWRLLRFDFIRNKLSRDQLLGLDEAILNGIDITTEHQLDIADYDDYTTSKREWNIGDIASDEKVGEEEEKISETAVEKISKVLNALSGKPMLPTPITNLGPSVIGISLLGAPLLGKTRLGTKLAQKFRMGIVSIPTTLKLALEYAKSNTAEPVSQKDIWMKKLGDEIIEMEAADAEAEEEEEEGKEPLYMRIARSRNLTFALVEQIVEYDLKKYNECGGWICDGWPCNNEQVMLLEFRLRGPICDGVLDQDPESFLDSLSKKFKPPPPPQEDGTGAPSVLNAIITLMPEDDEEEEEAEEKEGDAEEEEEEEEEKIGNKLQRARAENLYIKTATGVPRASVESSSKDVSVYPFKTLMESYEEQYEKIIEMYEGRCLNEMLDVDPTDIEDESIPMCPTRQGLIARDLVVKAYGATCNRLPVEVAEGEKEQVEEGKAEQKEVEANEKTSEAVESDEARLWRLERESMEQAVKDGNTAMSGRKIDIDEINEVSKMTTVLDIRFQEGAFIALKQLRELNSTMKRFWSDTRQAYRSYLESNKSQKRLVTKITKKLKSIGDLNSLSANQYQKIVEQLRGFAADAIDALYLLTTEKQDDAEDKINDVKNSKWDKNFLSTAEAAFTILLDCENKRFIDRTMLCSAYKMQIEGPYTNVDTMMMGQSNAGKNENGNAVSEAMEQFRSLIHTMPKTYAKFNELLNNLNSVSDKNEFTDEIVAQTRVNIHQIAFHAQRRGEMILNGGMSNLATMEKWMGEIIDIESQSIAYFSTLVRNAVDRLTRGESLPLLEFSFTQPIKDSEISPTVLDSRGTDVTNTPLAIPSERLSALIRALREAATPKGKNPLGAAPTLPIAKFVETMMLVASADSLTPAWKQLSNEQVTKIAKALDPDNSGIIYWREFIQSLLTALIPATCLPTPRELCNMYSDFKAEDAASPTVSSSDIVEWTEYTNVDLWFERYSDESRIALTLSQSLRDLYWYTWVGPGGSSGVLDYPLFLFHLCLDPNAGPGEGRTLGLHKAWVLMCEMKGVKNLKLSSPAISGMMSMECFNPRFPKSSRLFTVEEIQENIAIDFQTFLSRGKELGWFNDEGLYPFKLKNIYDGIIDQDLV